MLWDAAVAAAAESIASLRCEGSAVAKRLERACQMISGSIQDCLASETAINAALWHLGVRRRPSGRNRSACDY